MESKPERGKKASHATIWRKRILGKGLRMELGFQRLRNSGETSVLGAVTVLGEGRRKQGQRENGGPIGGGLEGSEWTLKVTRGIRAEDCHALT